MKNLFSICLLALLLSACAPVSRSVIVRPVPAIGAGPATITPEVKVVQMATATLPPDAETALAATPTLVPGLPTPTVTPVAPRNTWEELGMQSATYRDTVGGLEFDYPADWLINSLPEADRKTSYVYTVTLRSRGVTPGPKQQEGIPPDMTAVDVTVVKNGPKTLEQAIAERRAAATSPDAGQPAKIIVDEDWTLANGLKVHLFTFNLGKDAAAGSGSPDRLSSEVVTMINGQMVLFNGYGDLSLFNLIVASVRLIN